MFDALLNGHEKLDMVNFDFLNAPSILCLQKEEQELLLDNFIERTFEAKTTILDQQDTNNSVFFIQSGEAHVCNYSLSGRAITYTSLSTGDVFGEMSAIDNLPRSAWVFAINRCKVFELTAEIFLYLLARNHKFALAILRKLSSNIRNSNDQLVHILSLGVEQRACIELMRMAKPDPVRPDTHMIAPVPTRTNFANMIGSSRETVSRVLSRLKEDSIISVNSEKIRILDRKRLENRAFK